MLFHLFIRLASSCDYLQPEHRYLKKDLSLVSVVSLSPWIPSIIFNLLTHNISSTFFILASLIFCSSSFVSPMVYALRIPEFKQALNLLCLRRHGEMVLGRERGRVNIAAAAISSSSLSNKRKFWKIQNCD